MSVRFLQIAVVYLFLGAALGLIMGITQKFALVPVHAHLLLLGWASLALAGIVYHLYPAAAATKLARIHFWLHNVGLPVFMLGLGWLLTGGESAAPVVAAGATAVLVGLALFAANVLVHIKPAP
ncbi:MAG: cytochrome-c oxidase [Casimicrobiaceae bacterium]